MLIMSHATFFLLHFYPFFGNKCIKLSYLAITGYQMPNLLSTDIEVYGMQGIPSDLLEAHYGEEGKNSA